MNVEPFETDCSIALYQRSRKQGAGCCLALQTDQVRGWRGTIKTFTAARIDANIGKKESKLDRFGEKAGIQL